MYKLICGKIYNHDLIMVNNLTKNADKLSKSHAIYEVNSLILHISAKREIAS